jgi:hypothetical protein
MDELPFVRCAYPRCFTSFKRRFATVRITEGASVDDLAKLYKKPSCRVRASVIEAKKRKHNNYDSGRRF